MYTILDSVRERDSPYIREENNKEAQKQAKQGIEKWG